MEEQIRKQQNEMYEKYMKDRNQAK